MSFILQGLLEALGDDIGVSITTWQVTARENLKQPIIGAVSIAGAVS